MNSAVWFGRTARGAVCVLGAILLVAAHASPEALGQASERAIFVANNGNLEGSVTAFLVNDDGTLSLVNRVITGTRPNLTVPCPGCNPYEISLSPGGQFLATGHASTSDPNEQLTFFAVAADGSIAQIGAFSIPGTPMDVAWIDDELLAVERVDTDYVVVYRFNPVGPSLSQVDAEYANGFSTYLAVHPTGQWLYASDSGSSPFVIRVYRVEADGTISLVQTQSTASYYPLEIALTHGGTRLYAAGGITHVVQGFKVGPDGLLTPLVGSPFPEFGSSPSNVALSTDDAFLLVGHGTDGTLRSASINPSTGALTYTGHSFTVGGQGELGDVQTLDDFFFTTDNSTASDGKMGIYSFTLNGDGSFTQHGPIVSTGGIAPRSIATWKPAPPAPGDMNCDGLVNGQDIDGFTYVLFGAPPYTQYYAWTGGGCNHLLADMNGDGLVNGQDIDAFVAVLFGG